MKWYQRLENFVIILILVLALLISVHGLILNHDIWWRIGDTVVLVLTLWILPSYVFISASRDQKKNLKNANSKSAQYQRWLHQGRHLKNNKR